MTSRIEWIDADSARVILDGHRCGRPLSRRTMDKIANDLIDSDFPVVQESVTFDESGQLVDGQTRLSACIKTETEDDRDHED